MEYKEYPMFKGLQKPLVFWGLSGRYIVWGAVGGISCFLLFAIGFAISGLGIGLLALIIGITCTMGLITYKQKKGLHSKKIMEGIHITNLVFRIR